MKLHPSDLQRFQLEGLLGEGADFQVFAATDTEFGQPVVVKRPHPTFVVRGQHKQIERRLAEVIALRETLGNSLPHVARLIGYTPSAVHDAYFGDSLAHSYTVTLEDRAKGIPLVGSAVDGLKSAPIGLPQNVFALHPLATHSREKAFSIARDLLDVAETFHNAGFLPLDMRPQNVFFNPRDASINVIDVGSVTRKRAASGRRAPSDLHDFYLEIFRWYFTPADPPQYANEYSKPYGMETVPMFAQNLDSMVHEFSAMPWETLKIVSVRILSKVRGRAYPIFDEFRQDFEEYLTLSAERYSELSGCVHLVDAWNEARLMLNDKYWRNFLFDPEEDMVSYDSGNAAC